MAKIFSKLEPDSRYLRTWVHPTQTNGFGITVNSGDGTVVCIVVDKDELIKAIEEPDQDGV